MSFRWLFLLMLISSTAFGAEGGKTKTSESFQVSAKTTMNQIRALPDHQNVRMANGNVVRVGNLKKLANIIKMAKMGGAKPPQKMTLPQGVPQLKIQKGFNFHELATRKNSDVIQLPSGTQITVEQYKKIDAFAKIATGRSFAERQAPMSAKGSGAPIKIKSAKDLAALAGKPDSTILESPLGKKITLGELRAYAKKNNKPVGVK